MKILKKDLKAGIVKALVEVTDDLWYLQTILGPGDIVTSQSEYKMKLGSADAKQKVVKKRVWVAISIEKIDFETDSLRLNGKVVDGSEEVPRASYHGLDIVVGTELSIKKEKWLSYQLDKLNDAVKSASLSTLLVLFDREQALFARLQPNGYEVLLEYKGNVPKKGVDEEKQHKFYKEIVNHLTSLADRYKSQHIIAASPSFWKQYLEKELPSELRKKILFSAVSGVERTAINELLRRPELQKALEGERSAREEAILEELMTALSKDFVVYGKDDILSIVAEGNVREMIVTETALMKAREQDTFGQLNEQMKLASDLNAAIKVLSTKDAMYKVDCLGGIVVVKRW